MPVWLAWPRINVVRMNEPDMPTKFNSYKPPGWDLERYNDVFGTALKSGIRQPFSFGADDPRVNLAVSKLAEQALLQFDWVAIVIAISRRAILAEVFYKSVDRSTWR